MTATELLHSTTRERGDVSIARAGAAHVASDVKWRAPAMLRAVWSASDFDGDELTHFAAPVVHRETQHGVFVLGVLTMLLMGGLALLYYALSLGPAYVYTFALLAALAGHTAASAKMVSDIMVLYLLGMVLLAACGLAFVLLAHRYGVFTPTLFSTVVLLFMVVPLVPWGLREGLFATGIVYSIFTVSTWGASHAFTPETLWTLQFLMLAAATIALAVVARAVLVRKAHVEAGFRLTAVNGELYRLSHRDALTGAHNRRFLEEEFKRIVARNVAAGARSCFGLIDIDKFKQLNDTYGHLCGDRVLQRLVQVLMDALGPDDYVIRMGGDEFAMMLRGVEARQRVELALRSFTGNCDGCPELSQLPRVSVGLAYLPLSGLASLEESYLRADKALYAAKDNQPPAIVEVELCGIDSE